MRLNAAVPQTNELFLQPLAKQINLRHPLVQLATLIDWNAIDQLASAAFASPLCCVPFFCRSPKQCKPNATIAIRFDAENELFRLD